MKGAVVLMLLNLIVKPLKVLVAVTVCEELVVPTLTLPKARLVGLTTKSAAEAGFAAASPNAKRRKKLKTENAKMDDFGRNMINPPESNPVITNASEGTHHHFQTSEASIVFSNRRQIGQPSLAVSQGAFVLDLGRHWFVFELRWRRPLSGATPLA